MAYWLSPLTLSVLRGTVSLPGKGDGAGELHLRYDERRNKYAIYARRRAGDEMLVCELSMFYRDTQRPFPNRSLGYPKYIKISRNAF